MLCARSKNPQQEVVKNPPSEPADSAFARTHLSKGLVMAQYQAPRWMRARVLVGAALVGGMLIAGPVATASAVTTGSGGGSSSSGHHPVSLAGEKAALSAAAAAAKAALAAHDPAWKVMEVYLHTLFG
jgi:hypothetical protein